jgi:hypothetical protein
MINIGLYDAKKLFYIPLLGVKKSDIGTEKTFFLGGID